MLKTKDIIHARIKNLLPEGGTVPPLNAVDTILCEVFDDLRQELARLRDKVAV